MAVPFISLAGDSAGDPVKRARYCRPLTGETQLPIEKIELTDQQLSPIECATSWRHFLPGNRTVSNKTRVHLATTPATPVRQPSRTPSGEQTLTASTSRTMGLAGGIRRGPSGQDPVHAEPSLRRTT
ncbi:hypothetical protein GCM10009837_42110 [Streptomyces durmitorensis]